MAIHDNVVRCFGDRPGQKTYADYHDTEWGVPLHDEKRLFEMLILEGAQAGLSWETILKKRANYRLAFCDFDPVKVSKMTDQALERLQNNNGIIRNRLKIHAARNNARVFLKIQKEFGSFDHYVWGFVRHQPIINAWQRHDEIPVSTAESEALSKDLKQRGMTFVGPTIMYAFMQAVGMVNDHLTSCFCYYKCAEGVR